MQTQVLPFENASKRTRLKSEWSLTFIALLAILGGCGGAQQVAPAPIVLPQTGTNPTVSNDPLACGAGRFLGPVGCFSATDLRAACQQVGGFLENYTGHERCQYRFSVAQIQSFVWSAVLSGRLAVLNPSDTAAASAYRSGVVLSSGDLLEIQISGEWGSRERNGSYNCDLFDFNGVAQENSTGIVENQTYTNDGLPMGLLGRVGNQSFLLSGENGSGRVRILQRGELLLGVNANAERRNWGVCASEAFWTGGTVTRCMLSNGATESCEL